MTIGLSLPLGYLIGINDTPNARYLYNGLGKPGDCLPELKDHGVTSIELQGFGPEASASSILFAAKHIIDSGMRLTIHGYLSKNAKQKVTSQLLPTFNFLKDQQQETVLVVHALAYPDTTCSKQSDPTACALQQLTEGIQLYSLPVSLSLEINRYHGVDRPGTTYINLLEITQHLDKSIIGFCWDMGHTQSSILQHKLPANPPLEFIERVNHTHVHGLSMEGDTHWPLTTASTHVASAIGDLQSVRYEGAYNLELYPTRWGTEHRVREEILASIELLQIMLMQNSINA